MGRNISWVVGILVCLSFSRVEAGNMPDPCQLLTFKEVTTIMDIPMKPGKLKDKRSYFMGIGCNYSSVGSFDKSGSIDITIDTTQSMKETDSIYESAKDYYEREKYAYTEVLKDHHEEDTFHAIEGLGNDAFWNHVSLIILEKNTYINIHVNAGAGMSAKNSEQLRKKVEAKNLFIAKKAAKLLLERLHTK